MKQILCMKIYCTNINMAIINIHIRYAFTSVKYEKQYGLIFIIWILNKQFNFEGFNIFKWNFIQDNFKSNVFSFHLLLCV